MVIASVKVDEKFISIVSKVLVFPSFHREPTNYNLKLYMCND